MWPGEVQRWGSVVVLGAVACVATTRVPNKPPSLRFRSVLRTVYPTHNVIRGLRQVVRRSEAKVSARDATIKKLRDELASFKEAHILKKGVGRYFSARGGLQLALRQAASLSAAHSFGIAVGVDVHTSSVSAWQVRLRACQLLAYKTWYMNSTVQQQQPPPGWHGLRVNVKRIRSDATNANI